jgi:hypothetical protein
MAKKLIFLIYNNMIESFFKHAYPLNSKAEKPTTPSKVRLWPNNEFQQNSPTFKEDEPFAPMSISRNKFHNYEGLAETPGFS